MYRFGIYGAGFLFGYFIFSHDEVMVKLEKWGYFDNSFSRFMSRKSWGLYLFHYLPLSICAWYLHTYTTLPAIAMYICVGIAAFAGAFILYEIILYLSTSIILYLLIGNFLYLK